MSNELYLALIVHPKVLLDVGHTIPMPLVPNKLRPLKKKGNGDTLQKRREHFPPFFQATPPTYSNAGRE